MAECAREKRSAISEESPGLTLGPSPRPSPCAFAALTGEGEMRKGAARLHLITDKKVWVVAKEWRSLAVLPNVAKPSMCRYRRPPGQASPMRAPSATLIADVQ